MEESLIKELQEKETRIDDILQLHNLIEKLKVQNFADILSSAILVRIFNLEIDDDTESGKEEIKQLNYLKKAVDKVKILNIFG